MEKNIYIAILGNSLYEKSIYHIGNRQVEGYFGLVPYIQQSYSPEQDNYLYCLVTDEVVDPNNITPAESDEYPDKRITKNINGIERQCIPNNFEYIKKYVIDIDKNTFTEDKIIPIKIDINIDGIELYNLINREIISAFENEKINLHIDATNSFRSMSLTMFPCLRTLEEMHDNVLIKAITYWRIGKNKNFYFDNLLEDYKNINYAENIALFNDSFHISGFNEMIDKKDSDIIKQLNGELKKIEKYLQYVNIGELCKHIRTAKGAIEKVIKEKNTNSYLLPYVKKLNEGYDALIDNSDVVMALNVAKELKKKGQIQLAVTYLESAYNMTLLSPLKNRMKALSREIRNENLNRAILDGVLEKEEKLLFMMEQYSELMYKTRGSDRNNNNQRKINSIRLQISSEASNSQRSVRSLFVSSINNMLEKVDDTAAELGDYFVNNNVNDMRIKRIVENFKQIRNPMNHGRGRPTADFEKTFDNFADAIAFIFQSLKNYVD